MGGRNPVRFKIIHCFSEPGDAWITLCTNQVATPARSLSYYIHVRSRCCISRIRSSGGIGSWPDHGIGDGAGDPCETNRRAVSVSVDG